MIEGTMEYRRNGVLRSISLSRFPSFPRNVLASFRGSEDRRKLPTSNIQCWDVKQHELQCKEAI